MFSYHGQVVNVLLADGVVTELAASIDERIVLRLLTPNLSD